MHFSRSMSDYYFYEKYLNLIGFKSFKKFYEKLENAVINDLAMSSMEFKPESSLQNDITYYGCFNIKELFNMYDTYANIINHLERNKYKIKTKRKIEIFEFWFYILSIINKHAYTAINYSSYKIKHDVYSFKKLFTVAKSILYELPSLEVCFNYKALFQDNSKDSQSMDEINNDLIRQPDILTRTICSKSINNMKLLFEHGYKLDTSLTYSHQYLKTPLHWAFYSDNLQMFDFLITNGLQIDDDDMFYGSTVRKNFKFCLYLHFLRSKETFDGEYVYKKLDLDDYQAMQNFNIYEKYSLEQIIGIFESIFKIGFDFMLKFDFIRHSSLDCKEYYYYKFTIFASCIGQDHINSSIIDYLITKLTNIYGIAKARIELVESLKHCLMLYRLSCRLKSKFLNKILEFILPMLNETDLIYFKKIFSKDKKVFTSDFEICYVRRNKRRVEEDYLFNRTRFRILDLLYNYDILDLDDSLRMIAYVLDNVYINAFIQSERLDLMMSLSEFILYLVENQFLKANTLMEWAEQIFQDTQRFDAPHMAFLVNKFRDELKKFSNLKPNQPKSLFYLAKFKIRQTLRSRSKQSLNQLVKSNFFQKAIIETFKIKENYFKSCFDFNFK